MILYSTKDGDNLLKAIRILLEHKVIITLVLTPPKAIMGGFITANLTAKYPSGKECDIKRIVGDWYGLVDTPPVIEDKKE